MGNECVRLSEGLCGEIASGSRSEGQHVHGLCSSSLDCSFPQSVGVSLPWDWCDKNRNSPVIKAPLYFSGNSVCSVCALLTEVAFLSVPVLSSQEP